MEVQIAENTALLQAIISHLCDQSRRGTSNGGCQDRKFGLG
jgi:hypothetical protein